MSASGRRILVLALGNDILGDDAAGLLAGRALIRECPGEVEVVESSAAGLALMEMLEGYERALLLDAILTGRHPPGTVLEFSGDEVCAGPPPGPHYAGIPEILRLAGRLELPFPEEIRILAVEIEEALCLREGLSPAVRQAVPALVERARQVLREWGVRLKR